MYWESPILMIWGGGERGLQGVREAIYPKEIAINFVYFSISKLHGIQRNWGPSDACGCVTTADGAVICKSQINSRKIAKNIVYFCMYRLHDMKCNWGPSDAEGRVTTGRRHSRL